MTSITAARQQLAEAVTAAGLECTPYPPDSLAPPAAFVDTLTVDYTSGAGWSFCDSGDATAAIVTCAQRNDRAGSQSMLEGLVPDTVRTLTGIPGLRVLAVGSGTTDISGSTLPAVIYTVGFAITG